MKRHSGRPGGACELLPLIYELLDAHADTIELRMDPTDQLRWEAHLDYLRALQRRAREILARSDWLANPTSAPRARP